MKTLKRFEKIGDKEEKSYSNKGGSFGKLFKRNYHAILIESRKLTHGVDCPT